jgi:hypothetical protein
MRSNCRGCPVADYAQLEQLLREAVAIVDGRDTLNAIDLRDWLKEAQKALAEPTRVWVLFHETNTGHSEVSDGYVEAVYATEALAEAAKLTAIRTLVAEGEDVYWNPDAPEGEQEGPDDWTDDFTVLGMTVKTALDPADPLALTCPTCGAIPGIECFLVPRVDGPGAAGQRLDQPHKARVRKARATQRRVERRAVRRGR